MRQRTLAEEGFETFRKPTRRERFLTDMDQIIPWRALCKVIEPFYPKPKGAGRPPVGLERMLRTHFLQHWFNLSDSAVEEALYDSRAMRRFVGIDLGREPAPDETTVCTFRHLLEAHNLGDRLFVLINEYLGENGLNRGLVKPKMHLRIKNGCSTFARTFDFVLFWLLSAVLSGWFRFPFRLLKSFALGVCSRMTSRWPL